MFPELTMRILEAGGIEAVVLAGVSLVATCWGVVNFIRRHERSAVAGQLIASMLPACVGLWCLCRYLLSYTVVWQSDVTPQVAVFHEIVRKFLATGFLSLIGTIVPAGLAAMCLFRERIMGLYCGCVCYGLPVIMLGAGLTWGHWFGMIARFSSGTVRWAELRGDAMEQLGGLLILLGALMVFVGTRGLVTHIRRSEQASE